MINSCEFCSIPEGKLGWEDFYEKMILWRRYVNDGLFKFKGGDALLENFEEEIAREQKYVYCFYFECNCGNYLKSGVCIRSSVPVIEHVTSIPAEFNI